MPKAYGGSEQQLQDAIKKDGRFVKGQTPWNKGNRDTHIGGRKSSGSITLKCSECGKDFNRKTWRHQDSIRRGAKAWYCADACFKKRKSSNWKGGTYTGKSGYRYIWIFDKHVLEHRYIVEQKIGRKLKTREHVHHINGIKSDNRIENLQVMDIREHLLLEAKKRRESKNI